MAQNQQKMYADKHRVERSFKVGDLVYLRLQPSGLPESLEEQRGAWSSLKERKKRRLEERARRCLEERTKATIYLNFQLARFKS
jgi:hypothetical protein